MAVEFKYKTDDAKQDGAIIAFVRLSGDYLFDKVVVTGLRFENIGSTPGVIMNFEYTRAGQTSRTLRPMEAPLREFAEMRQAKASGKDMAECNLVKRLFSWASAEYNSQFRQTEADLVEEVLFVNDLLTGGGK